MVQVNIIEPDITREENEENLKKAIQVLEMIAETIANED